MDSDRWPIEIDGMKFNVQRTFANHPGVYVFKDGEFRHCGHGATMGQDCILPVPEEGDTIIIAKAVEV